MTAWICSLALLAAEEPAAPEFKLSEQCVFRFATVAEGQAAMTADDAFTRSLSKFDLQCRLKTADAATLEDWKKFAAEQVRSWEEGEIKSLSDSLARLAPQLGALRLPLPPTVLLVRTSGLDEVGAAYTRGKAIVLPGNKVRLPAARLDALLVHELFHVLSRHDGAFRSRLYRIIGFELSDLIPYPKLLADRRLTNPDAPLMDCTIELPGAGGRLVRCAPLLYASATKYDAERKPTLFSLMTFRLLVVEPDGSGFRPQLLGGQPVVIDPRKEPAFFDKVGKNTNYIIHPDEILADNFEKLVLGAKNLATPRIIDEMRAALAK